MGEVQGRQDETGNRFLECALEATTYYLVRNTSRLLPIGSTVRFSGVGASDETKAKCLFFSKGGFLTVRFLLIFRTVGYS